MAEGLRLEVCSWNMFHFLFSVEIAIVTMLKIASSCATLAVACWQPRLDRRRDRKKQEEASQTNKQEDNEEAKKEKNTSLANPSGEQWLAKI